MSQCAKCADFLERRTFPMPDDYLAFVGTLIDAVKRGDLQLIKADCPLEQVLKNSNAGGEPRARVALCGMRFLVSALCEHL
jgi:hypothetical protein